VSIGAVVGSLYAMGYSPAEMLEVFKSQDFAYWQTGEVQEKYVYSYKHKAPEPDIVSVKFRIKDSLIIEPNYLPASLINPIQMNLQFLALFSQATAVCGGNFDNLFVPFRCLASDVYRKESVILSKGDLGNSVRASMTFPLMFKPIEIDGKLLFDGGIYDNFSLMAMRSDFKPDYIIGSIVAGNPRPPDTKNLRVQILNMVMQHTDYNVGKDEGIVFDFDEEMNKFKLMDFSRADEMYQYAYEQTMLRMDSIKAKVASRRTKAELQESRKAFRARFPELKFKNIKITGVNSAQQQYIEKSLHERNECLGIEEFKKNYFKLIADNGITEINPTAVYNAADSSFDLQLKVRLDDEFRFSVGGNISSSVSSQAFFGLSYQRLQSRSWSNDLTAQFGKAHNALQLISQVDFPGIRFPYYLKLTGTIQDFNFYENNEPFFQNNLTTYFVQQERFVKFGTGFPITMNSKMGIGVGIARLNDFYYQTSLDFTRNNRDFSRYDLLNTFLCYQINTLNDKQYATGGHYLNIVSQVAAGNEKYTPGAETPAPKAEREGVLWWQTRASLERYFLFSKHLTLGIMGDAVYSTRRLGDNYAATILQAPAFKPTIHSRYTFNEAFSANRFVAGGVMPMYNFTRQLSLRGGFYGFLPLQPIGKDEKSQACYGDYFSTFEYVGEVVFVFRLPFLSASVFVNHYSSPARNWNFGFNIGYLLFNKRFLE
jgi:NTE family protein